LNCCWYGSSCWRRASATSLDAERSPTNVRKTWSGGGYLGDFLRWEGVDEGFDVVGPGCGRIVCVRATLDGLQFYVPIYNST
jgi:hypothetical protein